MIFMRPDVREDNKEERDNNKVTQLICQVIKKSDLKQPEMIIMMNTNDDEQRV